MWYKCTTTEKMCSGRNNPISECSPETLRSVIVIFSCIGWFFCLTFCQGQFKKVRKIVPQFLQMYCNCINHFHFILNLTVWVLIPLILKYIVKFKNISLFIPSVDMSMLKIYLSRFDNTGLLNAINFPNRNVIIHCHARIISGGIIWSLLAFFNV